MTISYSTPMSSSAFWTRQHGCPDILIQVCGQRWSLTATVGSFPRRRERPYDTPVRAVVVGQDGEPALAEVPEPDGPGELVRVLACGLCGSDVEKLDRANAGVVLGHEVVAETRRRAAASRSSTTRSCGECERCLAGHESTCERFAAADDPPRRLRRARARAGLGRAPRGWPDWRGTMVEPLACVLRGAERVPAGRVLIVGNGFVGRLFGARARAPRGRGVRRRRRPASRGPRARTARSTPPSSRGRGGVETALEAVAPGGTRARLRRRRPDSGRAVYRRELTVVGVALGGARAHARGRRAAPRSRRARAGRPAARALRRRARALPPPRRAEGRLRAVRALRLHGPGDLRLEDVAEPVPGDGDVLLQVEVALTDGTDLKAYRRGHPVLLGPPPSPFGHEVCGIDVATGRRVVRRELRAVRRVRRRARAARRRSASTSSPPQRRVRGAPARPGSGSRARTSSPFRAGLASEVAAMAEPLACCLHGDRRRGRPAGRHRRRGRPRADRADALRVRRRRRRPAGRRRLARGAARARRRIRRGRRADPDGADVVIEAAGTVEAWERALELVRPGGTVLAFGGLPRDARVEVDPYRIHYEEVRLVGAFHHTPRHFRAALAFLASGAYPVRAPASPTRSGSRASRRCSTTRRPST